jgi:hypothetical protein
VDGGGSRVEVEVVPVQPEKFALAEPGAQGEFVQGVEPVAAGCVEELPGLARGERLEAPGAGCRGLDISGDVTGKVVFADGVFQGGLEDRVDVGHGQRGEPLVAALADGATLPPGHVPSLGAALAGGAESVEKGADVAGGEPGELLGAEAGDEVEADAGGVSGVSVLPYLVDGDAVEPVRQVGRGCPGR